MPQEIYEGDVLVVEPDDTGEEIQVFGRPRVFVVDCPTVGGYKTVIVRCDVESGGETEECLIRMFYEDETGTVKEVKRAAQSVAVPAVGCGGYYYRGFDRELRLVYSRRQSRRRRNERIWRRMRVWVCEPYLKPNKEYKLWLEDEEGNESDEITFKT